MAGIITTISLLTRIRMVNNAILEYNAMQVSPYELFLVKSQEVDAGRHIDTLRDYWITRAELERAVGGTLTPRKQAPSLSQDKTVVKSTQKEKKR